MIFLRMMRFVEYEKINLIDRNERVHEALVQYLCSANNDHVVSKDLVPRRFLPKIASHFTTQGFDLLV